MSTRSVNSLRVLVLSVLFLAELPFLSAQTKRLISGSIIDAATKEPLPYVTVSLKKQLIGTVTNEEGKFDFYIPQDIVADTLLVNYLGYKHCLIALSTITQPLDIRLEQTVVQLEEIVIKPLSPENYITLAMRKVKQNYPADPFQTVAYYREKILENKTLIKSDEGLFKTYYETYIGDSMLLQNQLMLFKKEEYPERVTFMKRFRSKVEVKDSAKKEISGAFMNLSSALGGPAEILRGGNLSKDPETSLDTLQFKNYRYSFAKSSSYNTNEVLVIDFVSRKKIDRVKEKGKIYIDLNSLAIIKMESSGDVITPGSVKTLFFFLSIGFKNLAFERQLDFEKAGDKWYPKNIQNTIHIKLTNNHMFREDEYSDFEIEQFLGVNELKTVNPLAIPQDKRFDLTKPADKQVFPEEGISWEGQNIIKKTTVQ